MDFDVLDVVEKSTGKGKSKQARYSNNGNRSSLSTRSYFSDSDKESDASQSCVESTSSRVIT
jgi:hypothetical protein